MSNLKRLIKQSFREGTLAINGFCYALFKLRICGKYTAGLVSMDRSYYRIERKYRKSAEAYIKAMSMEPSRAENRTVWMFWWQGEEVAPPLVKKCIDTARKHFEGWNIVVVDRENYADYVDLPSHVMEKHEAGSITHTHFSDILRVALLVKHGGLWLDATVYCTGGLEEYMEGCDLFCYRNGWMDQENISFSSWLIYAKPGDPILKTALHLLYLYWEKNNRLCHYFLLHMFIRMAADRLPEEWNRIPYFSHADNHLLAEELLRPYCEKRFESLCRLTHFHKLTNKNAYEKASSDSFYTRLIGKN